MNPIVNFLMLSKGSYTSIANNAGTGQAYEKLTLSNWLLKSCLAIRKLYANMILSYPSSHLILPLALSSPSFFFLISPPIAAPLFLLSPA